MKKIFILNIAILFLLTACFSTDVVEVEIAHDEYLVVQSTLKKDSLYSGTRFTKTLSLNEPYNIKNAELKGVVAYLLINDTLTIPLHYFRDGLYMPLYPHKIIGGAKYELFAEYNGTKIYSKTNIPDTIITKRTKLSNEGYITTLVEANSKFVYGAIWKAWNSFIPIVAKDFHSIVSNEETGQQSVDVRTETIPGEYLTSRLTTKIYAFDKFYRKYFQSKGNNQSDSLFSNVTSPTWNIGSTSTKVIGVFIGTSESKDIKVNF